MYVHAHPPRCSTDSRVETSSVWDGKNMAGRDRGTIQICTAIHGHGLARTATEQKVPVWHFFFFSSPCASFFLWHCFSYPPCRIPSSPAVLIIFFLPSHSMCAVGVRWRSLPATCHSFEEIEHILPLIARFSILQYSLELHYIAIVQLFFFSKKKRGTIVHCWCLCRLHGRTLNSCGVTTTFSQLPRNGPTSFFPLCKPRRQWPPSALPLQHLLIDLSSPCWLFFLLYSTLLNQDRSVTLLIRPLLSFAQPSFQQHILEPPRSGPVADIMGKAFFNDWQLWEKLTFVCWHTDVYSNEYLY